MQAGGVSEVKVGPADCAARATGRGRMIRLTRLNQTEVILNSDLIEHIEMGADTVVTLTNGSSFVVQENAEQILDKIVAFKGRILGQPRTADQLSA
jgi:flagellar protein FlbD